jgi:cytidylate kinase
VVEEKRAKEARKENIVICVCGMAGSGKSTQAKKLAEKFGLKYYSGGDALKALAAEEGHKTLQRGWWESKEGMRFLERRGSDPKFDQAVDKKLSEFAQQGNVVLDSWTMPWLLKKGFKVWLEASPEKRARRIAGRDCISVEEATKVLKSKEDQTKAIYKKLYGFSLGEDYTPFDLILDTDSLRSEEVFEVLCMAINNLVFHNKN